ncbi:MAG: molybdopterin-dependent oxidoreductase [Dehalococcoidia bacterium]|uniref:molybdopterin-dependent oxidoreductase n=1 Tax=Candidatus Amarobacter glycogenicus TaxID=3140699 RepID=UPI003134D85D|nr:molybdopterin-dependent oxidoreductase [Dehalococcoidia bacterium]
MKAAESDRIYTSPSDLYRKKWDWDAVYWGTHCVDCYPGNCPMRVYVRGGQVWREEQSGSFQTIEPGVPDFNPMGCQKGASWSQSLYGPDRLLYPLKRVGERGEGRWNRVTWDEALTDIADRMIDAIEAGGPSSIAHEGTPEMATVIPTNKFFSTLGGHGLDLNGSINDFSIGLYETFGRFSQVSSADDWFHSEVVLIWHMNPIYTRIPFYHFIAEARYNGAEVINISPDVNPSHLHADIQVPINGGTDPAFGLALVQVILEEGLANWKFIKEQTDLGFLVRTDTRRYLRQADVEGQGPEDQMYQWAVGSGIRKADRANIFLKDVDIALEGTFDVQLKNGSTVQVRPAYDFLKQHLNEKYTPEKQQPITGVHPDVIRTIARKCATKRTNIMLGYNACKFYHGDLMERAQALLLAVTGNWGKKGTGIRCWASGMHDGAFIAVNKPGPGAANTEIVLSGRDAAIAAFKQMDPTATTEIAVKRMGQMSEKLQRSPGGLGGMLSGGDDGESSAHPNASTSSPPAFWWYWQANYQERWNTPGWGDDSLPRSFDEYFNEAISKGWWEGMDHPRPEDPPRVLIECGGNMLRRTRGGKKALLNTLWPKLDLIVSIDFRISQTGLYSDYVLPAAQHYEKIGFHIPTPHLMNLTFSDKAAEPAGEARNEWQIYHAIFEKIAERASERGLTAYKDTKGMTRRYAALPGAYSMKGFLLDEERLADEQIRDSALAGTLPMGTSLRTLREKGHVRFIDWGLSPMALAQASPIKPNETHVPFRDNTERGTPFPTYARRAQFYIDHEWFLEAHEELPTYKPNPNMGGDYPIGMTSGHNRWSIHTMNQANWVILGTHRGEPDVVVNTDDAADRGVKDGDLIRIWNDVSQFKSRARVAPNVKRGQLISYNGWAGFQYPEWSGANEIEPGMVKWIGFAGGYGHLSHLGAEWQPVPAERWTRCDFEKAEVD